jgi:hypothetical protein
MILAEEGLIALALRRHRQLDTLGSGFSHHRPTWSDPMRNLTIAGGEVRAACMAVPLLAVATVLAPAVARADPVSDYVSRNGKAVCAALDKVQDGGDIFRLTLTIRHDGRFSVKDAASIIGRSAAADCPWDEPKLKESGDSAANPATSQAGQPDH